jgi:ribonuclease HI
MGDWLCYTDGACKAAHGGAGGWGFHLRPPSGSPIEGWGKAVATQAKVMEYRAVAEALERVAEDANVTVFSDNQSLVENLAKKLDAWRAGSFAKVDPLVVDEVRRIDRILTDKRLVVRWQWVRGHSENAGNERADQLAAQGAREAKADLKRG